MIQRSVSSVVALPVEQVWAQLADHHAISGWVKGMSVRVDENGRRSADGEGVVRHLKLGPAPALVEEIVEVTPPRALGYRALSGVPFRRYGGRVELQPQGASTRIEWTLMADPRVPVVELLVLAGVVRVLMRLFVGALLKA